MDPAVDGDIVGQDPVEFDRGRQGNPRSRVSPPRGACRRRPRHDCLPPCPSRSWSIPCPFGSSRSVRVPPCVASVRKIHGWIAVSRFTIRSAAMRPPDGRTEGGILVRSNEKSWPWRIPARLKAYILSCRTRRGRRNSAPRTGPLSDLPTVPSPETSGNSLTAL